GRGRARVELDCAADRVAAGERALRPAQDLDAVDVEQLNHRPRQGRVVDVVDVDPDAGLDGEIEIRLPDAADERDHRLTVGLPTGLEDHVRRLRGDVHDVRLAARLEHRRIDGRDRDGRVLNVRLAELGRDDDLFELPPTLLRWLRARTRLLCTGTGLLCPRLLRARLLCMCAERHDQAKSHGQRERTHARYSFAPWAIDV